jgi:hypothetical protein
MVMGTERIFRVDPVDRRSAASGRTLLIAQIRHVSVVLIARAFARALLCAMVSARQPSASAIALMATPCGG